MCTVQKIQAMYPVLVMFGLWPMPPWFIMGVAFLVQRNGASDDERSEWFKGAGGGV